LEAVRLRAGDNVIKAHRYWNDDDDSVNENFGHVYAAKPSVGPSGVFDDEIWLWDYKTNILYSKSSNQCLESVGNNNTQTLGTSPCSNVTNDQKWSFENGYIVNHNDAKFCIDVDVHGSCETTPNGNLVVKMSPCNVTKRRTLPIISDLARIELIEFGIKTDGVLTELSGKVTWQTPRQLDKAHHQWFYDLITTQSIKNRFSSTCLDAPKRMNGGDVLLSECNATNVNQNASDEVDALVYLLWCDKKDTNQQWNLKLVFFEA
ncbi:hypothetical protein DYB35_012169, partial [Aphanomyces astaci]